MLSERLVGLLLTDAVDHALPEMIPTPELGEFPGHLGSVQVLSLGTLVMPGKFELADGPRSTVALKADLHVFLNVLPEDFDVRVKVTANCETSMTSSTTEPYWSRCNVRGVRDGTPSSE